MTSRAVRQPLSVVLLSLSVLCSACGGGGSSSSGPPPPPPVTPTPIPTPTPTQGPTPPPTCPNTTINPVSEPLQLATPLPFPNVSGYCGLIQFPAGSSPVAGNTLTLTTAISLPAGYPTVIPPGAGYYGVGATPVAPWLTYSVSKTLKTPSGTTPLVSFVFPSPPPLAFYYIGLFDLTVSNTLPIATTPYGIAPARPRGAVRSRVTLRTAERALLRRVGQPSDVTGGDQYLFGLFAQPHTKENVVTANVKVAAGGGKFTLPTSGTLGVTGQLAYGQNTSTNGSTMSLTSSNVDPTGGLVPPLGLGSSQDCSAPAGGTPVFYEQFILSSSASAVSFATTTAKSTLSQLAGGTYFVCWYDVTNESPSTPASLVLNSGPLTAASGSLEFPTLFTGGFSYVAGNEIIAEFVKD